MMQRSIVQLILVCTLALLAPQTAAGSDSSVPREFSDCIETLKRTLPKNTLDRIKGGSESAVNDYHFSVGTWIRNNVIRAKPESPISKFFAQQGIAHPDNMSAILLTSLWRDLNSRPIRLEEQLREYKQDELYMSPEIAENRAVAETLWKKPITLYNGKTLKLEDFRGKPLVVALVYLDDSSMALLGVLNEIRRKYQQQTLPIIAVLDSQRELSEEEQDNFLRDAKARFPISLGATGFVDEVTANLVRPGGLSFPELILIGKDGHMTKRFHSWTSDSTKSLRTSIDEIVNH